MAMIFHSGISHCKWFCRYSVQILIIVFFIPLSAIGEAVSNKDVVVQRAIESAHQMHLDRDLRWRALLHYKPVFGIFWDRSLVDDERFFLAKQGKTDPAVELEATIRAFFESSNLDDRHPQCRFPARYLWLSRVLPEYFSVSNNVIPKPQCSGLKNWLETLNGGGVTLVFPSSFINRPASMFGHTLLRIDNLDNPDDKLLSYA